MRVVPAREAVPAAAAPDLERDRPVVRRHERARSFAGALRGAVRAGGRGVRDDGTIGGHGYAHCRRLIHAPARSRGSTCWPRAAWRPRRRRRSRRSRAADSTCRPPEAVALRIAATCCGGQRRVRGPDERRRAGDLGRSRTTCRSTIRRGPPGSREARSAATTPSRKSDGDGAEDVFAGGRERDLRAGVREATRACPAIVLAATERPTPPCPFEPGGWSAAAGYSIGLPSSYSLPAAATRSTLWLGGVVDRPLLERRGAFAADD